MAERKVQGWCRVVMSHPVSLGDTAVEDQDATGKTVKKWSLEPGVGLLGP